VHDKFASEGNIK